MYALSTLYQHFIFLISWLLSLLLYIVTRLVSTLTLKEKKEDSMHSWSKYKMVRLNLGLILMRQLH